MMSISKLLLLSTLAVAPFALGSTLPFFPVAMADDDGGGDDGGDDDDDDGPSSRPSQNRSTDKQASKPASKPASKARKVKKTPRPVSRPLLVVLDLDDLDLREVRRRGYRVLRDDTLQSVGTRVHLLRLPPRTSLASARRLVAGLGGTAAGRNDIYRPQSELACKEQNCNPLRLVGFAPGARKTCTAEPNLGLIETRVDVTHPALTGQRIKVLDFKPAGQKPSTPGHGTAVTLILLGADKSTSPGLLPNASAIVAVPYHRTPQGDNIAYAYDVVRAIDALVAGEVDAINMSMAGPENEAVEMAVARAKAKGIPLVASVGNSGAKALPLYPAAYDSTVAVTAISTSLKIYRRAGQGQHVDFSAPGVGIEVTNAKGSLELKTGTSFAAPYVTSALALLKKSHPEAKVTELVERLAFSAKDLGSPGKDVTFGWGLVQLAGLCDLSK